MRCLLNLLLLVACMCGLIFTLDPLTFHPGDRVHFTPDYPGSPERVARVWTVERELNYVTPLYEIHAADGEITYASGCYLRHVRH